jgi:hypothetical protein
LKRNGSSFFRRGKCFLVMQKKKSGRSIFINQILQHWRESRRNSVLEIPDPGKSRCIPKEVHRSDNDKWVLVLINRLWRTLCQFKWEDICNFRNHVWASIFNASIQKMFNFPLSDPYRSHYSFSSEYSNQLSFRTVQTLNLQNWLEFVLVLFKIEWLR